MVVEKPAKKLKVDLRGLAAEWDSSELVRNYLRENPNEGLFHEGIDTRVKHASYGYINWILQAILLRSCGLQGQPQPRVRGLREQLSLLYKKNHRVPKEKEVFEDGWHIRKFLVLIKNKTKKKLVSIVPGLKVPKIMHLKSFDAMCFL